MKNVDIIKQFYAELSIGDAPAALALLADDIEWTTMWQYKALGSGPKNVAEGVLIPLMNDWREAALASTEFIVEGNTVVSLGHFTGVNAKTGRHVDARYSHVWEVKNGKIITFRQYIDTLAVMMAGD